MNTRDTVKALRTVALVLEQEHELMDDFHAYAHEFGGSVGCNVFELALRHALSKQGLTLEEFRRKRGSTP
jgi:hypothetical protein